MTRGTIIIGALLAGLYLAESVISDWSEWIALALIIIAGIPHGSFDLRVAEAKWSAGVISKRTIISLYVCSVLAMSSLCIGLPSLGLGLFLIISTIHFIEGERYDDSSTSWFRSSLFGFGAILIPIGLHLKEAGQYIEYFVTPSYFTVISPVVLGCAVTVSLIMCCILLFDAFDSKAKNRIVTFQRALCLVGWVTLSPLAGFGVWFIGRHSRLHLSACAQLFRTSRTGVPLDFLLISGLAILGLSPFALLFDFRDINQLFAATISLIAGLTLPHIFVAHGLKDLFHT